MPPLLKNILMIFFAALSLSVSQTRTYSLSGRVTDFKDNAPLEGVNVFISGSIWGTTTDRNGNFILGNIPPGNHQIVVSMIGYKTIQRVITLDGMEEVKLDFGLEEKIYELKEVNIVGKTPDDWYENLDIFKKYFLGQSDFADECVIENETLINFSKTNDVLTASLTQPLIITNNALGYKIECYLLSFKYDFVSGLCTYFFNTKFNELTPKNEEEKEEWDENRRTAYRGSLKHFLVSLIHNNFKDEGFNIYIISHYYEVELKKTNSIISQDSLNRNEYHLTFLNDLIVRYSPGFWRASQYSILKMLTDEVTLDKFGEPKELLPFQVKNFWATRGIADLVPKNYFGN